MIVVYVRKNYYRLVTENVIIFKKKKKEVGGKKKSDKVSYLTLGISKAP